VAEGIAPPPFVTGDDLVALGLRPGPRFRTLLDAAYDRQLVGAVRTRAEALDAQRRAAGAPETP
jgi:poly(A) polymerase